MADVEHAGEQQRRSARLHAPDGTLVALRPTVAQLLFALYLDHGHEVAAATLVARVWGDEPPRDPAGSLHQTVARLRRSLPDGAITRTPDGYRFDLPQGMEITADDDAPDTATPAATVVRAGQRPSARPFIGRDALVRAAVDAATNGSGTVFHGIAGNGRTRMVDEVTAAIERTGRRTALLHCRVAGPTMPLGAVAPLLPGVIPQQGVSMVVAAREAIIGSLGGEQLFLGVDDLHLLDASSAALISQLVTSGTAVLVGSYRNMAVVHEPVAMLWHENFCRHVHVPALDRAATRQLIEATLPDPPDDAMVDDIWSLTLGNPLFVTTVLAHGDLESAASDDAVERLVAEQLAGLPAELRDALTVIALAEPVGAWIVEQLCDPQALVALERRLLIRPERNARRIDIRMRHPLYGAHLRASASQLLVRGIRAQLLEHVVALGARRVDDLARVAEWATATGRSLPVELAVRAALDALARGDARVAERLARNAWDGTGDVRAAVVWAESRYASGEGDDVAALVAAVEARAPEQREALDELHEVARRTELWKLGRVAGRPGAPVPVETFPPLDTVFAQLAAAHVDEAEATLRTFLAGAPSPRPDQVAVATATLGWVLGWRGRPAGGVEAAVVAARSLTASGHRPLARWAWIAVGDAAVAAGNRRAIDEAIMALRDARAAGVTTTFDTWIDIVIAGRHRVLFEFDQARTLLRAAAARSRDAGNWFDEAVALHDLIRSGGTADEVVGRLGELAGEGRELAGLLSLHAASFNSDDEAGLVAITERLVAAGMLGYAVDSIGRAGELAAAAGARQRARDLGARWEALVQQCDTPVAAPPVLAVEPLTSREREVALLAMDGHTSRAIAERLGLSVRTVDNHLAHVFTKLGITSRQELFDALARQPG
jgi:DNA-binding CsgD family transcriptional regulator/DNA-binding winged helix-turn-helix (wHTH) protein